MRHDAHLSLCVPCGTVDGSARASLQGRAARFLKCPETDAVAVV